jgi:predicted permease
MKAGSRVAGGADRSGAIPFGKVLVVAQVALSLALLVGALLFLRTFSNLLSVDTGYDRAHVMTARFDPRMSGYEAPQLPALYARLTEQAQRLPGVQSASIALYGAVTGAYRISTIVVEGRPVKLGEDAVREEFVDSEYFKTLAMPLLRGRRFRTQDDTRAPLVAIVNTAMTKQFFGDDDPIGKRFGYDTTPDTTIVGLVADARIDGLRERAPAMIYRALAQAPNEFARTLFVRVSGSADAAIGALERGVKTAEPNLALREVVTLDELAERTVSRERLVSRLTGLFGLLAVGVACLGLYGTVSYSVARRTNEIGIRLALGAEPSRVRGQVLAETMWLVTIGCVAGVGLALLTMGFAETLLYGLSPRDPATLAMAAALLVAIGALAGALPAWRASHVDPMRALRAE